ncbi:MAG: extracellular solute-binding protein [Planctomycetota bacterium]|nr:MAG: extracellular solute-binding protein [Planctomycetota bacterium]
MKRLSLFLFPIFLLQFWLGTAFSSFAFATAQAQLPATEDQDPVVLRVMVHERWFDGFRYLEQTAQEFERSHPGVRVEIQSSASAAGGQDKVKFVLAGRLPVDVTWIDITEFAAFLQEDVLLDLQEYFDRDPNWRPEDYFPQILDAIRNFDGHLYGLPSTFTPYVMYVNQSLLAQEGLAQPADDWTWKDLKRVARAVTRDLDEDGEADQWGISITQWLQALSPWIWQNGGRFLDENGRCALAEKEAIEAVDFLVDLLHREKLSSRDATFEAQLTFGAFQAGKTAFYGPVGYWETYRFKDIGRLQWDWPQAMGWQPTLQKGVGEQRKWQLPEVEGAWAAQSYAVQDRQALQQVLAARLAGFRNGRIGESEMMQSVGGGKHPLTLFRQRGDLEAADGRLWPDWMYLAGLLQTEPGWVLAELFGPGEAIAGLESGFRQSLAQAEVQGFRWDVMPLPRGKETATAVAMRFYVVPKTSRHPQLAYEFVRALAGDTMQAGLARIGNGVPGLKRAALSRDFLKPTVPPHRERVFLDVLENARFMPVEVNWREIEKQTKAVFEDAIRLGRRSAEEVCVEAAALANETLDRERWLLQRPPLPRSWFLYAQYSPAALFLLWFLSRRLRSKDRLAAREERAAWWFLTPWVLGFLLFLAGPALVSAILSFSEWSPVRDPDSARWLAGHQYQRLWQDGTFHDSLRITAYYAVFAVPLQLGLALLLALLLKPRFPGVGAFRTLFYLPTIISPVILGAVWRWLFAGKQGLEQGLFNQLLALFGIAGPDWLEDPVWVVPAFVLLSLWSVGAQMLVFLAGLQGVDPRLYEAARLDGAGAWARFRNVTLPAISPLLLFNLIMGLIQAFQVFAQAYVMTGGGPGNESRFLVLYLYEQGFRFLRMGYASTLAWVLFAVVLLLSLLILRSSSKWVHYAGAGR